MIEIKWCYTLSTVKLYYFISCGVILRQLSSDVFFISSDVILCQLSSYIILYHVVLYYVNCQVMFFYIK